MPTERDLELQIIIRSSTFYGEIQDKHNDSIIKSYQSQSYGKATFSIIIYNDQYPKGAIIKRGIPEEIFHAIWSSIIEFIKETTNMDKSDTNQSLKLLINTLLDIQSNITIDGFMIFNGDSDHKPVDYTNCEIMRILRINRNARVYTDKSLQESNIEKADTKHDDFQFPTYPNEKYINKPTAKEVISDMVSPSSTDGEDNIPLISNINSSDLADWMKVYDGMMQKRLEAMRKEWMDMLTELVRKEIDKLHGDNQ